MYCSKFVILTIIESIAIYTGGDLFWATSRPRPEIFLDIFVLIALKDDVFGNFSKLAEM